MSAEKLKHIVEQFDKRNEDKELTGKRRRMPKMQELRKDRMRVATQIIHQHRGQNPHELTLAYRFLCETEDEPIGRRYTATTEWQPLNYLYLDGAFSLFVLENIEGEQLDKNPTPDEARVLLEKSIEISFDKDSSKAFLAPIGGFFVGLPSSQEIYVRCPAGDCKYRLTVYPK